MQLEKELQSNICLEASFGQLNPFTPAPDLMIIYTFLANGLYGIGVIDPRRGTERGSEGTQTMGPVG